MTSSTTDIVLTRALFAHIKDFKTVVNEIKRILKDNGKLLIITSKSEFSELNYTLEIYNKYYKLVEKQGMEICKRLGPSNFELYDYIKSRNGIVKQSEIWIKSEVKRTIRSILLEIENKGHPSMRFINDEKNKIILIKLKKYLRNKFGDNFYDLKTKSIVKQGKVEISFD